VVVLNKPNKPDYSQAKAYRPISLLECTGKLMEKIVVKWVNIDIETNQLIPMLQFRLRLHHTTINAVAILVHCIQAMHATGNIGTLLLFNISGFFDNINMGCITQVFHDKSFPAHLCNWIKSFLTR